MGVVKLTIRVIKTVEQQTNALENLTQALREDIASRRESAGLRHLESRLALWASQGKPQGVAPALTSKVANLTDSIDGWVSHMQVEGKSIQTIASYRNAALAYLKVDQNPSRESIDTNLAQLLKKTTASNVATYQKALKSFFKHLESRNLWQPNPTAGMGLIRVPRRHIKAPTNEQVVQLLQAKLSTPSNQAYFHTAIVLLIETGVRIGEAVAIRQRDIDFEKGQIRVIGKGDKQRLVFFGTETASVLKTFIRDYGQGNEWLFPGRTRKSTTHWQRNGLEEMLHTQSKRLGLSRLTPHSLRHYFTTAMLKSGGDLGLTSRMLGHTSVEITDAIYRSVDQGELKQEHTAHSPLAGLRARQNGETP
jgi:integrase/recombinase XerD